MKRNCLRKAGFKVVLGAIENDEENFANDILYLSCLKCAETLKP